jgi:histidinol-phosphate aminotransferase
MAIRRAVQALEAYVPGEQPQGPDVLKLNTNENPYPPSPRVFEAIASIDADALRKYPHPVAGPLRRALAQLHGVRENQVLLCNGSDEGLALCTRTFCEHGGRVGFLDPSYSLYPVLSGIAELEQTRYPLEADFTWNMPERIPEDLFFLTQPNAPSGRAMSREQVCTLLQRSGGVVLVDEAYVDFADWTAAELIADFPNLLVSRTFSKSYSLAGIRMGYLLGSPETVGALYKIKDSYNTDVLAQRIALAAVEDVRTMQANCTLIRGTRTRVTRELEARGFAVIPSSTNFLFARVPEGQDARSLFEALKAKRIYIRYFPGDLTGRYLRITIGTEEQMDRFLEAVDGLLSGEGS